MKGSLSQEAQASKELLAQEVSSKEEAVLTIGCFDAGSAMKSYIQSNKQAALKPE